MSPPPSPRPLVLITGLVVSLLSGGSHVVADGHPDYAEALGKAILFFQGQRSGQLPPDQAVTWRSNSGLSDGSAANVDLTGGYYDAGDNVKFGFPMAFSMTMLSWSVLEHGGKMKARVHDARAAVRWGADYLLKAATQTPGTLYVGVGDPDADHRCWERPEDMDTPRTVYSVSASAPGSDVAGETAAALAAASMVFRAADPAYSRRLLAAARDVMELACARVRTYVATCTGSAAKLNGVMSLVQDELLWASAWLLWASKDSSYLGCFYSLGGNHSVDMFSWDNKLAGARVLLSRRALVNGDTAMEPFRQQAEEFFCRILPGSPSSTTQYTPGPYLLHRHIRALMISFLSGKLLASVSTIKSICCMAMVVDQVDYILGANPQGMSYMVKFGARWPQRIHHRASSLPSLASHLEHIGCQEGYQSYYYSGAANPNVHTGAVVGGPDENDSFPDDRGDFARSEPTTYTNAPLVGCLAYLAGAYKSGYN
nr:unnamed protein product [Digitaria exilis]